MVCAAAPSLARQDARDASREHLRTDLEFLTSTPLEGRASLTPRYGLGWQREPGAFGSTCSADTFRHSGSTGTTMWHDPASATTCVLLTTQPATVSQATLLRPVSEIVGRTTG